MLAPERFGAELFDRLLDAFIAAAEIGVNRLLTYDELALAGCAELQGHCIALEITDLDFQLYCHPGSWGLRFSRQAPPRAADAAISGRLVALLDLASQEDKLATSMRERVGFHGEVALAQKLQQIIGELDIDWEEMLAEHCGDVLAYQLHSCARRAADRFRQGADSILQTTSEYLREEARLSPTAVEFEDFQSQVIDLRHDVARAELRLERLIARLRTD